LNLGLVAVVLLLAGAATAIFWPLRMSRHSAAREEAAPSLETARDAKLAELHDLQLDFRLEKLSVEDYRTVNATLRAEAVELMRAIDAQAGNGRRPPARGRQR
jgi:hypothetical protein